MKYTTIAPGITMLHQNLRDMLFEGMWELPEGTSVNSYLINDEKKALIDGLCGWPGDKESLEAFCQAHGFEIKDLDYLIIHHMEPDHSGWLRDFLPLKPDIEIYCSRESAMLLDAFFNKTENVHVVKEGSQVELGEKTLTFMKVPNVHWPDTMMSFEEKTQTLFSCDAFGSFGALDKATVDNDLNEEDLALLERESRRYFACVLGTFSPMAGKAMGKVEKMDVKRIAPGHGPVHEKYIPETIALHQSFVGFQKGAAKKKVTLLWDTMYGMSEKVVDFIRERLEAKDYEVAVHKVTDTPKSTLLMDCWDSTGIIICAPTYEYKLFPTMAAFIDKLGKKKLSGKVTLYTGSYGWSGGAYKELTEIFERNRMKWTDIGDFGYKGSPNDQDFEKLGEGLDAMILQMQDLLEEG